MVMAKSLINEATEFSDEHAVISIVLRYRHAMLALEEIDPQIGHTITWWDFIPAEKTGEVIPDYDSGFLEAVKGTLYPAIIRQCPQIQSRQIPPHYMLGEKFIFINRLLKNNIDSVDIGGRNGFFDKIGWNKERFMAWKVERGVAEKLRARVREDVKMTELPDGSPSKRLRFRLSGKDYEKEDDRNRVQACNCLTWIWRVLKKLDLPNVQNLSFLASLEAWVAYDPRTCLSSATTDTTVVVEEAPATSRCTIL